MKHFKATLTSALAGLTLAGCATTAVVNGPTVISYDHGALDTLVELGLEQDVLAVPQRGLPDYLDDFGANLPDAGSLKVPDQQLIGELNPGLVLMTSRQGAESIAAIAGLAPVRDVTIAGDDFREAVNARVASLAGYYGLEQAADIKLDALWQHVDEQKAGLAEAGVVTVITHNDGSFSLRQEPVVYELLELTPTEVPASVQPMVSGERTFYPVTAEVLADMEPDHLLVVDRSAAIGAEPLQPQALQTALKQAGATTNVVVLDPGLWYLSGGGLQSVRLQVDEVAGALQ